MMLTPDIDCSVLVLLRVFLQSSEKQGGAQTARTGMDELADWGVSAARLLRACLCDSRNGANTGRE